MSVEIGAMLREARMRAQLDISDVEAQTKIRSKYLRALESEEWQLLPGATYVKSFLKTYADLLALDSKLLVEEFKLRHERPSEIDLQPIHGSSPGRSARRPPRPPPIPPWGIALGVVALLVLVLALLGGQKGSRPASPPSNRVAPSGGSTARAPQTPLTPQRPAARLSRVSLRITPTAPVYVCLIGDGGRKIINGQILSPSGKPPAAHRAKHFRLTLGNGSVKLRVRGQKLRVPASSSNGIGYDITPRGHHVIPLGKRPTCA